MPETTDPDAPWGYKPDGTPYKRDPSAFDHLRGKPFGTKASDAKAMDQARTGKPPRRRERVKDTTPPAESEAHYAKTIRGWAAWGGKGLIARGNPEPGKVGPKFADAGFALVVQADELGEAWGKMAIAHPKLGRTIDKLEKGSDASRAASALGMTAVMMARGLGLFPDGSMLARMADQLIRAKAADFIANHQQEFEAMMGGGDDAAQDESVAVATSG